MNNIISDFTIGTSASIIPIYFVTKYYFENNISQQDFDFKNSMMYIPIITGMLNIIIFSILRNYFSDFSYNPIVAGLMMSVALSMLTKTFNEIPDKVIKIKNSNMYHMYSFIAFVIFYIIANQLAQIIK